MTVSQQNSDGAVPAQVTQFNSNIGQQLQVAVSQLNTSPSTQVQTSTQAQIMSPMMSQSSTPYSTSAQVQVVQPQQLATAYLQHFYPQQQMHFPGNLTLQPSAVASQSLQGLGATQGIGLRLQDKPNDPKQHDNAPNLQVVNSNKQNTALNSGTMTVQMLTTAPKPIFQQQMLAARGGKSTIIHNQSGFSSANQSVIGQLGVLPNQQTIFNQRAIPDTQKVKTYAFQSQPTAFQRKYPNSSILPVNSIAQVFNSTQLSPISSQPRIITSPVPGNVSNQAQLFGLQTIGAPLPPGLSWATPGCLQSSALGQNPVIRNQKSNMYIQTQPQAPMHLPVAAPATQPMPPTFASTATMPQKQAKAEPRAQTVTVGTQTHSNTPSGHAQFKPRAPKLKLIPTTCSPQTAAAQTETNQPSQIAPQPHLFIQQKSDASNQTRTNKRKSLTTYSRYVCVGVDAKKRPPTAPLLKSQAMVASSTKINQATVSPCSDMSVSDSASTITAVSSSMTVLPTSTVQIKTSMPAVDIISTTVPSVSPVSSLPKIAVSTSNKSISSYHIQEAISPQNKESVEKEPLNPQQPIVKPTLGTVKEKQPQKAVVKPQVLTCVIKSVMVQEGPRLFSLRPSVPETIKRKEILSSVSSSEKKVKVNLKKGNVDLAKCEFCGKLRPKKKFKKSKRFCSTFCAKRSKVRRSKRIALLHSTNQAIPAPDPGRRKKDRRGRKSLKKQLLIEESKEVIESPVEECNRSATEDDSSVLSNAAKKESPSHPEDSSLPPVITKQEVIEMPETDSSHFTPPPRKLPSSWTVQDVFELVKNIPGCSDYADALRTQEIDGQALLLLTEDHLMAMMCMKLGPAVKLISVIKGIKEELAKENIVT